MSIYAADWNDAIIGGPTTSGSFLIKSGVDTNTVLSDATGTPYSNSNCPNVIRIDDWMSPVLALTNNVGNSLSDTTSRAARVTQAFNAKAFMCPENQVPATQFGATLPLPSTFLMPSYYTAAVFYWYPAGFQNGQNLVTRGSTPSNGSLSAGGGYSPRVSKVGSASRKAFMADGARFADTASQPDVNFTFNIPSSSGVNGYAFASPGPCFTKDNGFNRDGAPGNPGANGLYDPRAWSFRHGSGSSHGAADSFKGNVLFFDGHAEAMGDLQASDPNYWMPTDTQWNLGSSSAALKVQTDVSKKYCNGQTSGVFLIN
jgi:prepilin-type processing-associated H-X9-DG protein